MKKLYLPALVVVVAVAGFASAFALGGGHTPVTVCHHGMTLVVDDNAVPAHLGHGDTLGACGGGDTTPTDTTPTTPTDTTPTTPPPTGGGGGGGASSAAVYCDFDHYVVTGTVDGGEIDSASPVTIPGTFHGTTNVTLQRGDTSFRTSVFTYGDCVPKP